MIKRLFSKFLPANAGTASENLNHADKLAIVLSGGGSRAAYQVGALKALHDASVISTNEISIVIGSSIGAVNGLVLSAALKSGLSESVQVLEDVWSERTFRNTFAGHPTKAFLRAIQVAFLRYSSPGPHATDVAIFDPTPLARHVDRVLRSYGGLVSENLPQHLSAVAVMTTVEGDQRKPLLFVCGREANSTHSLLGSTFNISYVDSLSAAHGLASAALPSVLPPVALNLKDQNVRLVDGGICDNIPVDPAIRLGATHAIVLDVSGRSWWFDHYHQPHDTKPKWEVQSELSSYCLLPSNKLEIKNTEPLGMLLKQTVGNSRAHFMSALGPTWPIFRILKHRMGELLAYEVMSYVALHPEYTRALLAQGYSDTLAILSNRPKYQKSEATA